MVDLEDSEPESEEGSKDKPSREEGQNEDSIMVVDSDDNEEEEESGEYYDEDEEDGFQHGMIPHGYQPSFRGDSNKGGGGEDEPIEIESSSEETRAGET